MPKNQVEYNVPGIPPAPVGRKLRRAVDYDYMERKKKLLHRLPFYTKEEVVRRKHSYHVVLMHEMLTDGYYEAVLELHKIFRKEDSARATQEYGKNTMALLPTLVSQRTTVELIAQNLKLCQDYADIEEYEATTNIRKTMGEKFMKEGVIWLSKHFLHSALETCSKMPDNLSRNKMEAEINCLLAFLARDSSPHNLEEAMENAVEHLVICRTLAKNQAWQFKPRILSIKLKKPITLHGLREEYEVVDGSSMSLYRVATLLEHEMLIGLANEILHLQHMHHRIPTPEELTQAHIFADSALALAFEVRQPVALSSALMRFGVVLRHTGAYDDAIGYFRQLAHHSEISGDQETYAIAYHNIAMCQIGKHESLEALATLVKQKDTADMFGLEDLGADALQELGCILLQEGQLWESEECYAAAYESFYKTEEIHKPPHSHCNNNLAMWGIAAGQRLWSRFAGLVRSDSYEDISALLEWKNRRDALPAVQRPNYVVENIEETFAKYNPEQFDEEETTLVSTTITVEGDDEDESLGGRRHISFNGRGGTHFADDDDDDDKLRTPSPSVVKPKEDDYDYDFQSDYDTTVPVDVEIPMSTRKRDSAKRQSSLRQSLASVMSSRRSLAFPLMM